MAMRAASVINEDVEPAEFGQHGLDHRAARFGFAYVGLHRQASFARLVGEFPGRSFENIALAPGDRDVGSAIGEQSRDGLADARAAAGHHGRLVAEIEPFEHYQRLRRCAPRTRSRS